MVAVLALTVAVLALVVRWSPRQKGFARLTDCLSAYYEACGAGDATMYESCFADPLRSGTRRDSSDREHLASRLRQRAVKNWVVVAEPVADRPVRTVLVDEVREEGIERVRFRLEFLNSTWLIVGVDPVHRRQPPVAYGTDVRKVPDASRTQDEPPEPEETPEP